ncbi:hypothetical protein EDC32_1052 [Laceyella sacchari]|nr:hypothetical protein EDC32_1052 [Laceyella sacchari]
MYITSLHGWINLELLRFPYLGVELIIEVPKLIVSPRSCKDTYLHIFHISSMKRIKNKFVLANHTYGAKNNKHDL